MKRILNFIYSLTFMYRYIYIYIYIYILYSYILDYIIEVVWIEKHPVNAFLRALKMQVKLYGIFYVVPSGLPIVF